MSKNISILFLKIYLSVTIFAAAPASVNEPAVSLMLLHLLSKHLRIDIRMQRQESFSEACRESWHRFLDSHFGSSDFRGISSNKVVHGLIGGKLGNWRQHTEGIASQENYVFRVPS